MRARILTHALREHRVALAWWSAGLVALVAMTLAFWPTMEAQGDAFRELAESYPPEMQAFFGDASEITTPHGFLASQIFTFMGPILLLVYAIGRGTRALTGEENAGTLDVLLTHPVARQRIVLEKAGALAAGTAGLAGVLFLALVIGRTLVGMDIGAWPLASACVSLALLATLFGCLALAAGAVRPRRGVAIGVPAAIATGAFFLNGLAPLADWSSGLERLSPFHWYLGGEPLRHGLDPWHALLLAGVSLLLVAGAAWAFERRDVGV